jgi:uncharacterized protein (DUF2062 family)
MSVRHRLHRVLQVLLHVEDSPRRTALAFAIGVWIAFFPVLGLHTALALIIGVSFRLSRVALLLGAYVNNPWTLAPLYTSGTALGCMLLRVSPADLWTVDWRLGWAPMKMLERLAPFLWPFVVGNLVLGTLAAIVAYGLMRRLLERRRGLVGNAVSQAS